MQYHLPRQKNKLDSENEWHFEEMQWSGLHHQDVVYVVSGNCFIFVFHVCVAGPTVWSSFRTISGIRTLLQTTSSACWKRFCSQRISAISALEWRMTMRSTNLHLLTYLLTHVAILLDRHTVAKWHVFCIWNVNRLLLLILLRLCFDPLNVTYRTTTTTTTSTTTTGFYLATLFFPGIPHFGVSLRDWEYS